MAPYFLSISTVFSIGRASTVCPRPVVVAARKRELYTASSVASMTARNSGDIASFVSTLPDFADMAAITYVDTVVSHEPFTDRLLFHELVHVVQYEMLGLAEFDAKYVKGFLSGGSYPAIPLEMNAYELDTRFAVAPTKPFSVADEVQKWIDRGRF